MPPDLSGRGLSSDPSARGPGAEDGPRLPTVPTRAEEDIRPQLEPDAVPLSRFRFNGDLKSEGMGSAYMEFRNITFENNALYLNGKYDGGQDPGGYLAGCHTPGVNFETFSVA